MDLSVSPSPWDDATGLIAGFVFEPGQPAQVVEFTALDATIARLRSAPEASTGFAWLHFNLSHAGALRWLERPGHASPAFVQALKDRMASARIERDGDELIVVVNDVAFDFGFDASDVATLWMSVDQHLVISARLHPLRSVDQLRNRFKHGATLHSPAALIERLLRSQADVLIDIVRRVAQRIDTIEDEWLAGRSRAQRAQLGGLRRMMVRLQRLLAPEPASLFRLLQDPPHWMGEDEALNLKEANEEFLVVLRDMASLQERVRLLQDEIAAALNEANGRSLFVLTIVTVLALPINILAGLFGMNVGGVPLATHPQGFWVIVMIVAVFTALSAWWVARKSRTD